jgi:hypothetical protein
MLIAFTHSTSKSFGVIGGTSLALSLALMRDSHSTQDSGSKRAWQIHLISPHSHAGREAAGKNAIGSSTTNAMNVLEPVECRFLLTRAKGSSH